LLWRGTPWRLRQAIGQDEALQLFTSAALLSKLADVMTRPVPTKRLALFGPDAFNREVWNFIALAEAGKWLPAQPVHPDASLI